MRAGWPRDDRSSRVQCLRLQGFLEASPFVSSTRRADRSAMKTASLFPVGLIRALFDAQAIAFSWVQEPIPDEKHSEIVQRISEALNEEATLDAVRRATGDRRRIMHRVGAMVSALEVAQVKVDVPIPLNTEE